MPRPIPKHLPTLLAILAPCLSLGLVLLWTHLSSPSQSAQLLNSAREAAQPTEAPPNPLFLQHTTIENGVETKFWYDAVERVWYKEVGNWFFKLPKAPDNLSKSSEGL